MGSIALDSGVIIGLFSSADLHHDWAFQQVQDIVAGHDTIVISALTMCEVLVRPAQSGAADAVRADVLSLRPRIVDVDEPIASRAALLRATRQGLRLPDAIILATVLAAGCDCLVTTDRRLAGVAMNDLPVRVPSE